MQITLAYSNLDHVTCKCKVYVPPNLPQQCVRYHVRVRVFCNPSPYWLLRVFVIN